MKRARGSLTQVSIALAPGAEEPVAALCERLLGQCPATYTDAATGVTISSLYLEPEAWSEERRAALAAGLSELRRAGVNLGAGDVRVHSVRREDWAESWKKHFRPMVIARDLLIQPSWTRRRPRPGQALVILDPGLSFGTGQHPTTRFCLQQLVVFRRRARRAPSFLDVGTGSGILAVAAARLGYRPIHAFDFDPDAVRIARRNATQNRVRDAIQLYRADVSLLPARARARFDVVGANLTADLLVAHLARLRVRLAARGRLVLAGILTSQFGEVEDACLRSGLRRVAHATVGEWRSGAFEAVE